MSGLALTLLGALALLALLSLAVRDAFRQAARWGWTNNDDAQLRQVLGSGIESLG